MPKANRLDLPPIDVSRYAWSPDPYRVRPGFLDDALAIAEEAARRLRGEGCPLEALADRATRLVTSLTAASGGPDDLLEAVAAETRRHVERLAEQLRKGTADGDDVRRAVD